MSKRNRDNIILDSNFVELILDHLPVALFCKSVQHGFSFNVWNKTAQEWYGLKKSDVLGKNDYDFFPKEQADFFRKKDEETMLAGKTIDIPEEPLDTPNGKKILHTIKVPLRMHENDPGYLLGISWDITAEKEKDREIYKQRELHINQSKMAALGIMASGIAHEINNPLTVIMVLMSKLRIAANTQDSTAIHEIADKADNTVSRIGDIIRGLKSFSRETAPGAILEKTSVRQILDDVLIL